MQTLHVVIEHRREGGERRKPSAITDRRLPTYVRRSPNGFAALTTAELARIPRDTKMQLAEAMRCRNSGTQGTAES